MITSDSDLILNFKNENFLISSLDIKPTSDFFFFIDGGIIHKFSDIPNGDIFALATHKGFIDDIMDYSSLYEGFDVIAPSNSLRLSKPEDAYVAIGKKGMHCLLIYKCIYMLPVYCPNSPIVKTH